MNDIKAQLAKNIAELRQSRGMTQLELAEKLTYSDKAISKWERGESAPDIVTLAALAELFGVSLDELVFGERPAPSDTAAPPRKRSPNRAIVTGMSLLLVWFIALFVFILLDGIGPGGPYWLTFVYAVPVSSIVWLIFNSIWFKSSYNFGIVSLLVWSLLASVHISLAAFGISLWTLYLLGIPAQAVILLWSRLRFKKSPKA